MTKDDLLNMFVSRDPSRELHTPWTWKGYTGATDGYSMLLLPYVDDRYPATQMELEKIFPGVHRTFFVPVSRIRTALDSVPKIWRRDDKSDICPDCNSEGVVTCSECGQDKECDKCKGTGLVKVKGEELGPGDDPDALIWIHGKKFTQPVLRKVVAVAEFYEEDLTHVWIDTETVTKGVEFQIKEAKIIAMAALAGDAVARVEEA